MIAASILALAIAGPSHPKTVAQAPTPTPAVTATSSPSGLPTATATGVATATPTALATPAVPAVTPVPQTPAPTATPAPTPTPSPYGYRFVPRQPSHVSPGQPQIFAVYLNEKKLRSHAQIRIKVETSPDVVKVVSRSNGREGIVPLVAAGDFEATSVLPKIPFIAAGMSVDLEFIATGPDGRKTNVRVPVRLES